VISFTLSKGIKRDSFKVKCANFTDEKCNTDLTSLLGVGSWSDGDKTVTFKPTRTLEQQSKYALRLEGKDTSNRNLEPTEISFTTATAPVSLRYTPPMSAIGIPDGAYISVVFSKPMNTDSLKAAFSGTVNSRDGTQTRPLQLSRVEAFTSSQGGFGYSFVPSEKYGDGTVVTWSVAPTAMDAGGSRLLQAVADGFRVLQRITGTIPVDPNMSGRIARRCYITCTNELDPYYPTSSFVVGYDHPASTFVERGFIGFNLNGVLPENAIITKAIMNLKLRSVKGEPFKEDQLGPLSLQRVDYGPKLEAGDFDVPVLGCAAGCGFTFYGPPNRIDGPIDVTTYLQADWAERLTRGYYSQYRMRFANNKPVVGDSSHEVFYNYPTMTIEFLTP
jgi:hypothetical protein